MTARAVIPATQPNGVTPRASNARPYNQRENCNKILGSPGGVGSPRPRFCGNADFMGWFVGAAYMPPVAAARILRYNGKTARDAYMRPLQTCRKFAFFQLSLTFRLFVGRGLDPSLPFCGYRPFARRGGVTPPYIPLYKNVSAQRTLLISTLNSPLSTLSVRATHTPKNFPNCCHDNRQIPTKMV